MGTASAAAKKMPKPSLSVKQVRVASSKSSFKNKKGKTVYRIYYQTCAKVTVNRNAKSMVRVYFNNNLRKYTSNVVIYVRTGSALGGPLSKMKITAWNQASGTIKASDSTSAALIPSKWLPKDSHKDVSRSIFDKTTTVSVNRLF